MTLPGTLTNPPLAVGLAGLLDWSTAQPLLDHFKLARPWTGTVGGRFGALSFDDLRAQGVIDPQGWPLAVPEGVEAVSTVLLTELHAGAQDLAGRYLLTWRGEGEIALKGATAQAPQDGGPTRQPASAKMSSNDRPSTASVASARSTAATSRMPPVSSTFMPSSRVIFAISSWLAPRPKAASKSTKCSHCAPWACHFSAASRGAP